MLTRRACGAQSVQFAARQPEEATLSPHIDNDAVAYEMGQCTYPFLPPRSLPRNSNIALSCNIVCACGENQPWISHLRVLAACSCGGIFVAQCCDTLLGCASRAVKGATRAAVCAVASYLEDHLCVLIHTRAARRRSGISRLSGDARWFCHDSWKKHKDPCQPGFTPVHHGFALSGILGQ